MLRVEQAITERLPWLAQHPMIRRPVAGMLGRLADETGFNRTLDRIGNAYGRQGNAQRQARAVRGRLQNARIKEVFQNGLHEFIDDFVEDNNRLGTAIAQQYLM